MTREIMVAVLWWTMTITHSIKLITASVLWWAANNAEKLAGKSRDVRHSDGSCRRTDNSPILKEITFLTLTVQRNSWFSVSQLTRNSDEKTGAKTGQKWQEMKSLHCRWNWEDRSQAYQFRFEAMTNPLHMDTFYGLCSAIPQVNMPPDNTELVNICR